MASRKPNQSEGKYPGNVSSGRKYYLSTSDMKLPLPVIPMSDFEKHAQRKNRVIQALHGDELLKIGIDCETSRKLLSCDTRRFSQIVSSNRKPIPNKTRTGIAHNLPGGRKAWSIGNAYKNKVMWRNSSQKKYKTLAWVTPDDNLPEEIDPDKDLCDDSNSGVVDANEGSTFQKEEQCKQTKKCDKPSRVPSQSAKSLRDKRELPELPEQFPRRPNSATIVERRVTFWDMAMVKDTKQEAKADSHTRQAENDAEKNEHSSRQTFSYNANKKLKICDKNIEICVTDVKEEVNKFTYDTTKAVKDKDYNCGTSHGHAVLTPLSSYLHFNRLQASCELKRELRHNAENRKRLQRRRLLSEMLSTERNSYEECLMKLSSRLKDQKLLEFCRDSCKGMDNVFSI